MTRKFKRVDYEAALRQTVMIEECLPPNHLARFIVTVIARLDLRPIYARYAPIGGAAIDPVILLGLDRKSTRLNSSHSRASRMPSSA